MDGAVGILFEEDGDELGEGESEVVKDGLVDLEVEVVVKYLVDACIDLVEGEVDLLRVVGQQIEVG